MKKIILLLTVLITLSFNYSLNKNTQIINSTKLEPYGDSIQDVLKLRDLATRFNPKQLNLNSSLLENIELNNFLSKTDKVAIKGSPEFNFFITMILLKQYELHITKFHQGFDLFSMKAANAGFIVSSFVEMSPLPKDIKGINSSYIMEYIDSTEAMKNDPAIGEIYNRIKSISK